MRRVIVIGTIHGGFTKEEELESLLREYSPSQLLVEIVDADLRAQKVSSYPVEMVFAATWASTSDLPVRGFDSPITVLKEGVTKEDEEVVCKKQGLVIRGLSWKDFNKDVHLRKLKEISGAIIDDEDNLTREKEMLANIESCIAGEGAIVILTGAGHLPFFEKNLPGAEFPLRNA